MKVCVLLAVCNGEAYLREQLDSILQQKEVTVDVYVCLDSSQDSSQSILSEYATQYQNIILHSQDIKFGSAGQNFLYMLKTVDFSSYDYICFSDQDDYWLDGKLHNAIKKIRRSNADGYSSNVTAFWENDRQVDIRKSYDQVCFDYIFESSGPGCTFVLTYELAHDIQSFLESAGDKVKDIWLHDWFCYAYARSNAYNWVIDQSSYLLYRQHDSNSVGANVNFSAKFSRLREVLSGSALDKVMLQSDILGINAELPVKLLKNNTIFSYFRLALLASKCRRKPSEKVFFFFVMILLGIKRVIK